ncbi:MAG: putative Serine/threonine-protein kinase Nek3 [Streblomastix strix]|uniref:non-specific serine/threonine protein kinase n=1 Tax=Streblomastix strix TaxID=222440 RepID=A0A5J4WKX6_9EUKA|nr:MAG: putative Serine/threonine-protein kinase Nek3 [Streblomastix strix]
MDYRWPDDKKWADEEVALIQKLSSPYTMNIINTFVENNEMFIFMEYQEGGDIRKVITELQKLPEKERLIRVWTILAQLTRSVDYIHTQGYSHLDLRPSNIFMNEDGSIRLGIFGNVQEILNREWSSTLTPSSKLDSRTDIFSMSIIGFELLTGKYPFQSASEIATIEKIKNGETSKLPQYVTHEMNELVMSMMDHDPSKRPKIKQILEQETIQIYIRMFEEKQIAWSKVQTLTDVINKLKQNNEQQQEVQHQQQQTEEQQTEQQEEHQQQQEEQPKEEQKQPEQKVKAIKIKEKKTSKSFFDFLWPWIPSPPTTPDPSDPNSLIIEYINLLLISPSIDHGIINEKTFTRSNINEKIDCTVTVDPSITQGIVYFEVVFRRNDLYYTSMGIADSSVKFGPNQSPLEFEYGGKTVGYWSNHGLLHHSGSYIIGNAGYRCEQRVGAEIDMNERRITFFVEDEEQPVYVTGIPQSVRFWAYIHSPNSQFRVTRFERRSQSVSKGVQGSRSLEWGKEWMNEYEQYSVKKELEKEDYKNQEIQQTTKKNNE